MSQIVVVYYSRTGKTRMVAEKLAAALGADLEEVREAKSRSGMRGFAGGIKDAMLKRPAELVSSHSTEGRTTVVLGMPVWANRVPPAVRAYVETVDLADKTVCAFCTADASSGKKTFHDLRKRLGVELAATMEWRKPKADDPELLAAIEDLAVRIRAAAQRS